MLSGTDGLEIQSLLARYADATSRKDVDAWLALFTDDAVWARAEPASGELYNEPVEVCGRAELRRFAADEFAKAGTLFYVSGNPDILGRDDEGASRSSITVFAVERGVPRILLVGTFEDRYRRTEAGWRFASRTISIVN